MRHHTQGTSRHAHSQVCAYYFLSTSNDSSTKVSRLETVQVASRLHQPTGITLWGHKMRAQGTIKQLKASGMWRTSLIRLLLHPSEGSEAGLLGFHFELVATAPAATSLQGQRRLLCFPQILSIQHSRHGHRTDGLVQRSNYLLIKLATWIPVTQEARLNRKTHDGKSKLAWMFYCLL